MLISLSDLSAQNVRAPQLEVYLSLNHTQVRLCQSTPYFDGYKALLDVGLGFKYYFFASKRFNLIPGLEYNQYRFSFEKMSYSHYGLLYDVSYYLRRFTLPLSFRYNWGSTIKIIAQAGVFGEIVNDTQKETYANQFPDLNGDHPSEKVKYEVGAESNYGYHFGLGTSLPISKFRINAILEYRHGLSPLNDDYEPFTLDVIRMNIGFVF